ncbi:Crp/Fnr family transcriptional regulator [uncultured Flavobacterium sp.]|uniref:Crp/Fnr family transcriptional regulator n=1 Tax=uncultured Flavobacterium sp. TaxID=165435 RepID=UPI00292D27F0|nr:Crp/Fnr family transcriptional regulator [uncultured Flavobacterium sp.]
MSIDNSEYFKSLLDHIGSRISLNAEEQEQVCAMFSPRVLLPRQYLLSQGDICHYETYVCKGFLRSFYVDKTGNEHTLQFAQEDWWISDLSSFLNQEPTIRNIVALEKTVLLQIDLQKRQQLMEKVPKMEKFWRILNEKACIAQEQRILNNISLSGAERYQLLLNTYPQIEQRLPQKHIASFLGITPVFLSQIRRQIIQK